MKRIGLTTCISLCIAAIGQWALSRKGFFIDLPAVLGLPGFSIAHDFAENSHVIPYLEFSSNAAIYFVATYIVLFIISKGIRTISGWANSDSAKEIERRIYDHR
jgi:hypothetical protein